MVKSETKKFYDSLIRQFCEIKRKFPDTDLESIINQVAQDNHLDICQIDELRDKLGQRGIY